MGVTLYKVLIGGRSCHGGTMAWSLPRDGQPGEWHEIDGPIELCERGLHLTPQPEAWWKEGAQVYEVEAEGVTGDVMADTKVAARRVRLIREVSGNDYAAARGVVVRRGEFGFGFGLASDTRSAQRRMLVSVVEQVVGDGA